MDTLELQDFRLTPDSFPAFYFFLVSLRFPVPVSLVLDMRSVLHFTADVTPEPVGVPHYAAFRQALKRAVVSFGVTEERHRERLLKVLVMLRGVHHAHTFQSRKAERHLRALIEHQRRARARCVRNSMLAILTAAGCFLAWIAMSAPDWKIKIATAICALFALSFFRVIPAMDDEIARLNQQLNDILRRRIQVLHWKTLIHKLALLLGYKRITGIEIFEPVGKGDALSAHG